VALQIQGTIVGVHHCTHHFYMLVTASMDERDEAGDLTTLDVAFQDRVHSRAAGARESNVPGHG
jgi:hypothetical protein